MKLQGSSTRSRRQRAPPSTAKKVPGTASSRSGGRPGRPTFPPPTARPPSGEPKKRCRPKPSLAGRAGQSDALPPRVAKRRGASDRLREMRTSLSHCYRPSVGLPRDFAAPPFLNDPGRADCGKCHRCLHLPMQELPARGLLCRPGAGLRGHQHRVVPEQEDEPQRRLPADDGGPAVDKLRRRQSARHIRKQRVDRRAADEGDRPRQARMMQRRPFRDRLVADDKGRPDAGGLVERQGEIRDDRTIGLDVSRLRSAFGARQPERRGRDGGLTCVVPARYLPVPIDGLARALQMKGLCRAEFCRGAAEWYWPPPRPVRLRRPP